MMLLCKLAAAVLVAAVLTLLLKKDQPAFAFLVSVCTAAGLLAIVVRQVQPLLDWLHTLDGYFQGQSPAVLLQVLGIALVAQLAADTCKEAGLSAAATAIELCGRVLALLQALPLLQSLLARLRPICSSAFVGRTAAVFADELSGELPKSTRDILDESGTDLSDAARWRFSDLCDTVGAWAAEGLQPALHLAAQSAGYLLLAGLLGLLAGDPYRAYVEILAVLGFGTLSLSAAMQLTELVAATAQDCRTYLTAFVPVFSGLAAAGGRRRGRLSTAACFLPCPGFFQPSSKSCFCLSCSCISALRSRPACGTTPAWEMPPALFSRCLHWLLKGCGALFSLVLGLQSALAATADSAALRTGKGVLQGVIPVVGDAAAAALTGAAAAVQLLKVLWPWRRCWHWPRCLPRYCSNALPAHWPLPPRASWPGPPGKGSAHSSAAFTLRGHGSAGPCWCCISS